MTPSKQKLNATIAVRFTTPASSTTNLGLTSLTYGCALSRATLYRQANVQNAEHSATRSNHLKTKQMKIELKNIKYAAFASDDSNCFEGTIHIDGKASIRVSDDGNGGCMRFDNLVPGAYAKLQEYCKTLPQYEFYGDMNDETPETFIGGLLETHLLTKQVKSKLSRNLIYTYTDKVGIYQVKGKYTPDFAAKLRKRYPTMDKMLNELPLADAVAIFKADNDRLTKEQEAKYRAKEAAAAPAEPVAA